MVNKCMHTATVCLLLALLVGACSSNKNEPDAATGLDPTTIVAGTTTFFQSSEWKSISPAGRCSLNRQLQGVGCSQLFDDPPTAGATGFRAAVEVPMLSGGDSTVTARINADMLKTIDQLVVEARDRTSAFASSQLGYFGYILGSFEVTLVTPKLFSARYVATTQQPGQAHPSVEVVPFNYNLATGNRIGFGDMFDVGAIPDLQAIALESIRSSDPKTITTSSDLGEASDYQWVTLSPNFVQFAILTANDRCLAWVLCRPIVSITYAEAAALSVRFNDRGLIA